jgi:hypothetical protein
MGPFVFRSAPWMHEARLKPFSWPDEKRSKQSSCRVRWLVQRSMGIVMLTVLAIAVVVEIAILVAEIATRARLVTQSLTGRRVT